MCSLPSLDKLLSLLLLSFHIVLHYVSTASAVQVYVGAGQVSTTSVATSCDDIQEFSCVNDTCDQCAGMEQPVRLASSATVRRAIVSKILSVHLERIPCLMHQLAPPSTSVVYPYQA